MGRRHGGGRKKAGRAKDERGKRGKRKASAGGGRKAKGARTKPKSHGPLSAAATPPNHEEDGDGERIQTFAASDQYVLDPDGPGDDSKHRTLKDWIADDAKSNSASLGLLVHITSLLGAVMILLDPTILLNEATETSSGKNAAAWFFDGVLRGIARTTGSHVPSLKARFRAAQNAPDRKATELLDANDGAWGRRVADTFPLLGSSGQLWGSTVFREQGRSLLVTPFLSMAGTAASGFENFVKRAIGIIAGRGISAAAAARLTRKIIVIFFKSAGASSRIASTFSRVIREFNRSETTSKAKSKGKAIPAAQVKALAAYLAEVYATFEEEGLTGTNPDDLDGKKDRSELVLLLKWRRATCLEDVRHPRALGGA